MVRSLFRLFRKLTALAISTAQIKAASASFDGRILNQNEVYFMQSSMKIMSPPRLNLYDRFQFQSSHSLSMRKSMSRSRLCNSEEQNHYTIMDIRISSSTAFAFPPSMLLPWWRKKVSSCSATRTKKYDSIFSIQSMPSQNAACIEPIVENSNPTDNPTTLSTAPASAVSVDVNTQSDTRGTLLDTEGEDEPKNCEEESPTDKNLQLNNETSWGESMHLKLYSLTNTSATDATQQEPTVTNDQATIGNQTSEQGALSDDTNNNTFTTLHTYHHPQTITTLHGLGISLPKFKLWIRYTRHHRFQNAPQVSKKLQPDETSSSSLGAEDTDHPKSSSNVIMVDEENLNPYIRSRQIDTEDEEIRMQLRDEWFARHLICGKTEVLASYGKEEDDDESNKTHNTDGEQNSSAVRNKKPRGSFDDLLSSYADRLVDILQDEVDDVRTIVQPIAKYGSNTTLTPIAASVEHDDDFPPSSITSLHIEPWLQRQYGKNETMQLSHPKFSQLAEGEQLKTMKHFLEWFREQFPYFYDSCDSCGASYRADDSDSQKNQDVLELSIVESDCEDGRKCSNGVCEGVTVVDDAGFDVNSDPDRKESNVLIFDGSGDCNTNDSSAGDHTHNNDDGEEDTEGTFLGYVYPTPQETTGRSSRTELYHCHRCQHYTRFPRYNAVSSIVRHRRGRCGEYSILLYRILRDLGHNTRWVVDWADHVWAECWVGNADAEGENLPSFIEHTSSAPRHLLISESKEHMHLQQSNITRGRWIHLDPCEAAVDEPLLYQDWGKKQTFIMAFWAPLRSFMPKGKYDLKNISFTSEQQNVEFGVLKDNLSSSAAHFPFVEDVTQKYTTDSISNIENRREVSDDAVKSSIVVVEGKLRKTLGKLFQNCSPK